MRACVRAGVRAFGCVLQRSERERERERERDREKEREREMMAVLKEMKGALAPFSYLVAKK